MDDLQAKGYDLEQSLRELAIINKWLGGQRVLRKALEKIKPSLQSFKQSIQIADLGCGGGDLLAYVKKWGSQNSLPLNLYGYDANPHVIQFAQEWLQDSAIHFETANIFDDDFQKSEFDIVLLTLFCHHLTNEELLAFLRQLKSQTSTAIIINDLHRHPLAYHSIRFLTSALSRTSMVKTDAPHSVLRAFTRKEMTTIIEKAGFKSFELRWQWAFRWQLVAFTG